MTYGIELRNTFGAPVLSSKMRVLHRLAAGNTIDLEAAHSSVVSAMNSAGMNWLERWEWRGEFGCFYTHVDVSGARVAFPHAALSGLTYQTFGDVGVVVPQQNSLVGFDSSVFYQLGTAGRILFRSAEICMDLWDASLPKTLIPIAWLDSAWSCPYRIIGPGVNPADISGTYGMKIWDQTGELAFDSRAPIMPIRYAFIFTKAQMDDVIENGAVVTITLPEAMPDAWISAPFFSAYRLEWYRRLGGQERYRCYYVGLRQTSDTTLQFSRFTHAADVGSNLDNLGRTYTHDAVFYVARNIP